MSFMPHSLDRRPPALEFLAVFADHAHNNAVRDNNDLSAGAPGRPKNPCFEVPIRRFPLSVGLTAVRAKLFSILEFGGRD
jgi:hypothetical protein